MNWNVLVQYFINIGIRLLHIIGVVHDDDIKFAERKISAYQGIADAQYDVGMWLMKKDSKIKQLEGFDWLKKAANQSHVKARGQVGFNYLMGKTCSDVVIKDDALALEWYQKAAFQGDHEAEYMTGLLHERGNGTTEDFTTAMRWFEKSAKQGNEAAMYRIADMHRLGRGVPVNQEIAQRWFDKAIAASAPSVAEGRRQQNTNNYVC